MMFPPYVLAQIYVKGSLKNTEKGFEFNLKNVVDSGTVVEFGPITVDGKAYEAAALTIVTGSRERGGDQVTRQSPLPVYIGSGFTVCVKGEALTAGEHAIQVSVLTQEIGRLHFEVQDTLA
jgi:hydroxymethylglutaryl-CoA reductase (NADPH)